MDTDIKGKINNILFLNEDYLPDEHYVINLVFDVHFIYSYLNEEIPKNKDIMEEFQWLTFLRKLKLIFDLLPRESTFHHSVYQLRFHYFLFSIMFLQVSFYFNFEKEDIIDKLEYYFFKYKINLQNEFNVDVGILSKFYYLFAK